MQNLLVEPLLDVNRLHAAGGRELIVDRLSANALVHLRIELQFRARGERPRSSGANRSGR